MTTNDVIALLRQVQVQYPEAYSLFVNQASDNPSEASDGLFSFLSKEQPSLIEQAVSTPLNEATQENIKVILGIALDEVAKKIGDIVPKSDPTDDLIAQLTASSQPKPVQYSWLFIGLALVLILTVLYFLFRKNVVAK